MDWPWLKYWWRLKRWKKNKSRNESESEEVCYCDECMPVCILSMLTKKLKILFSIKIKNRSTFCL